MSQVAVIAKLPAAAGKRTELAQAFQAAIANAEGEAGTLRYILHEDTKDEDMLWVYELYTDMDAFKAHGSSDAFKSIGAELGKFMGGRPEIIVLKPVGGKGA